MGDAECLNNHSALLFLLQRPIKNMRFMFAFAFVCR
jgi:hypothetical protein